MKVAIVGGAGGVGASLAFNLLLRGRGYDVVLVDSRPQMITSHVMDLEQTLEQGAGRSIRGGGKEDVLDADIVVLAAGTPLTLNTSRHVYLEGHAAIATDVADLLAGAETWDGVLIVVTNPVDSLCTLLRRRTGLDRRRIVGYTLNDSLRLRTGIAKALGVAPGSVDAWVLGEHGDASVFLFDRVTVEGEHVQLSPEQQAAAEEFARGWYVRHVALDSARSSTWTSGLGVARMVDAIARPTGELWPASVVLEGEYGIEGVSLGVPVEFGRKGVEQIHEWELAPAEFAALRRSAALVQEITDRVDES